MAQSGGSATTYGILYQILGSLDWAVGLRLQDAVVEDSELLQARLIVEPAGGGGDLRVELPGGKRVVEQWKSRRTSRLWTLKELVDDVLPDLYLTVLWPEPQEEEVYRFVTEGKRNAGYEKAIGFFQELRDLPVPEEPLGSLDNRNILVTIAKKQLTRRKFFEAIVKAVRERKVIREGENESLTRQKLWHFLGRFEVQAEVSGASLRSSIDRALRPLVDFQDNIASKREQLCGLILELAGEGEVSLTFREFLQRAELDVLSLQSHSGIRRALGSLLERELRNSGYEAEDDVRRAPAWPEGSPVLAFSGESGQGKTWQLARLGRELAGTGRLVVWLPAQKRAKDDVQEAADRLWKEGCRHETPLGLGELARRWNTVNPNASRSWLTICIDDVQDLKEALDLSSSPWGQWGVQLAMTVPPGIAYRLQENGVTTLPVPSFLLSELRAYLKRRGRDIASVPTDVLETLSLPLLARIYCELSAESDWVPDNEYHLYKEYWRRIERGRQQFDFPQDIERIRRLALNLLASEKPYPWVGNELRQADVDDAAQRRLESVGWLRRQDPGTVVIVHDRLLNWAVAEAVEEQHRIGQMSTEKLVAKLVACTDFDNGFKRWLGYVPLDVLWLVSDPVRISASTIAEVLIALEAGLGFANLYEQSLPTLGIRIVPGLVERVRRIDPHRGPFPKWIVESLIRSIESSHLSIYEDSVRWLSDPHPFVQELAVRVLARFPLPVSLDFLWVLHESRTREHRQNQDLDTFTAYHTTLRALQACVRLDPSWLDSRIGSACSGTGSEMLGELARLLASCESSFGQAIWAKWKSYLLAHLAQGDRVHLISCVGAFRDLDEVPRLEEWARESLEDPRNAVFLLRELAWLAPDRAIALIPDLPRNVFAFAGDWLPALLLWRPVEVRKVVRDLMESCSEDFWLIARAYQHLQGELDPTTLGVILDRLAADAGELRRAGGREPASKLQKRWIVIAGVHRLDLLREIEARAETQFEADLSFLAQCWIWRREKSVDHELEDVSAILLQIGGRGWIDLIEESLRSAPHYGKVKALVWARCEGSKSILSTLRDIAHMETGDKRLELERMYAVGALAALGDDESVIEAILRFGPRAAPHNVLRLRKGWPPMSDALVESATAAALDAAGETRVRGVRALALTAREEILDLIPEMLDRVAGTKEHDAVLDLIGALARHDSEATRQLADKLDLSRQTQAAKFILLRLGTEEAFDRLEDYLRSAVQEGRRLTHTEMHMAIRLACSSKGRTFAAELVWRDLQAMDPFRQSPPWHLKAVAQLDTPEVQERLLAEAIQASDHDFARPDIAVTAIRGLAEHHPDDAFRASERALLVFDPRQDDIPALMVELDPDRAIPRLIEGAFREEETWRFWQTGRALRKVSGNESLRACLSTALCGPDPGQRAKAVQLCGWLGPDFMAEDLRRLVLEDSADEVRNSYLEASRRQRDQVHVRELLQAFSTSEGLKRWSYLRSVLEIGDPVLLDRRGDPLCVWPFLDEAEGAFALLAEKRLQERLKESEEAAKQIDRNRDWI